MKRFREANRIRLLPVSRCAAPQRQPRPIRRRFEFLSIFQFHFFEKKQLWSVDVRHLVNLEHSVEFFGIFLEFFGFFLDFWGNFLDFWGNFSDFFRFFGFFWVSNPSVISFQTETGWPFTLRWLQISSRQLCKCVWCWPYLGRRNSASEAQGNQRNQCGNVATPFINA